jgi:hypothetical protein
VKASDVIRNAIPDATDELCEFVLWGRTPYPCGRITARDLYKSAHRFHRASIAGIRLCECCDRIAVTGMWMCAICSKALEPRVSTPSNAGGRETPLK